MKTDFKSRPPALSEPLTERIATVIVADVLAERLLIIALYTLAAGLWALVLLQAFITYPGVH